MQQALENDVTEQEALLEELDIELAKRSYRDYVTYSHFGDYQLFEHTELICEKLQHIIDGEQKYYIFELPPRHSKSMTITETFPSYFLMKNPKKRVITTSYSDALAKQFGRKNRDKIKMAGDQLFDIHINPANSGVTDWSIDQYGGGMYSTSMLGGATGRGADLLIIDDPIKNREEAESKTIRDKIYQEWESTFFTRLHKGHSVIVIMTRWHEDDLIGRLLKANTLPWERIRLPALAEENDLLGRELGKALCPELGYNEEWAETTKLTVGSRTWASLYQQRPRPAEGAIFKESWLKFYVPSEEFRKKYELGEDVAVMPRLFDKSVQSWDMAFKDTKTSDFVAGHVWNRKKGEFYFIDRIHDRMGLPETLNAVRRLTTKHPKAIAKYIEEKANGPAVMQTLKGEISGMIGVEPEGGKETRAYAITPLFEAGNVYLPHPIYCPWINDVIEELLAFPNGEHDDDVDAMTQALVKLMVGKQSLMDRYKNLM
ncbi:phage terminase large subunit [Listeria monocytogenes]|nr:phage terminase large subunit [Listeria monocytogenes]EKF5423298.1 phage terminase large subunit [Listeria monocytogenes]